MALSKALQEAMAAKAAKTTKNVDAEIINLAQDILAEAINSDDYEYEKSNTPHFLVYTISHEDKNVLEIAIHDSGKIGVCIDFSGPSKNFITIPDEDQEAFMEAVKCLDETATVNDSKEEMVKQLLNKLDTSDLPEGLKKALKKIVDGIDSEYISEEKFEMIVDARIKEISAFISGNSSEYKTLRRMSKDDGYAFMADEELVLILRTNGTTVQANLGVNLLDTRTLSENLAKKAKKLLRLSEPSSNSAKSVEDLLHNL